MTSNPPQLNVLDDPARAVAKLLAEAARADETIVLTGGSSVASAYEQAAVLESDWEGAAVYWSDERCVPPDDERSNFGLAKRTLFDLLEQQPAIHRMHGELDSAEAARDYEQELEGTELTLAVLGLGSDGHVASLFPGSPQLAERERLVTSGPAGLEPFVDRITLTLPALLSAKRIVFLVSGADKASAVRRAFCDPISDDVPASLLRTGSAPISVYLSPEAAAS